MRRAAALFVLVHGAPPESEWYDRCSVVHAPAEPDLSWTEAATIAPARGHAEVVVRVDTTDDPRPISPWVYGMNYRRRAGGTWNEPHLDPPARLGRLGGNRISAFNWETGVSFSGADQDPPSNDRWLGPWDRPGEVVRDHLARAHCQGAAAMVTMPLLDLAAADDHGAVDNRGGRFLARVDQQPGGPVLPPDLDDGVVERAAFASWLAGLRRGPLLLGLGNEPSLWAETHRAIAPEPLTYADFLERTASAARTIRAAAPDLPLYAGGFYGFNALRSLQDAPDADGDLLDAWLAAVGPDLVDGLDIHWYPEDRAGGRRILESVDDAALDDLRMQAPRSLWDPSWREDTWIADVRQGPVQLLPWLHGRLGDLGLVVTEYSFGAEDRVSGGLALADALGALGRHDVTAAAWFPLADEPAWGVAALDLVTHPGRGLLAVGSHATSSDRARVSAWATASEDAVAVLLVHKGRAAAQVRIEVAHPTELRTGSLHLLGGRPEVREGPAVAGSDGAWLVDLPPLHAAVLRLR